MNIRHSFSICVDSLPFQFTQSTCWILFSLFSFALFMLFSPPTRVCVYVCALLQSPYPHQIGKFMVPFSVCTVAHLSLSLFLRVEQPPASILPLNVYSFSIFIKYVCVCVCSMTFQSHTRVCHSHSLTLSLHTPLLHTIVFIPCVLWQ